MPALRTRFITGTLLVSISLIGESCNRSPKAYVAKGDQFFAAAKYSDAELQYRKALQYKPAPGEAFYKLGLIKLEQNALAEAYPLLVQAFEKLPANEDVKVKLADTALALYVSNVNRPSAFYNQVTKVSDLILASNPASHDGVRLKGALALIDRKPKAAIEYFQRANQIKPMQPEVILGFTQALFLNDQASEGERLALALIRKEPAFGPIYDVLYRQYLAANRTNDGENILKMKLSANPAQVDYLLQLAEHYARVHKTVAISATIDPLLRDGQRFPQGHLKAGDFYARLGNWDEAIHVFQEAAEKNPTDKRIYQKRIVDAMLAQGKRAEAAQLVESVLRGTPKDGEFRRVRATLRMESGNPDDLHASAHEFAELVREFPADPALRFQFGRCLLAKGELSQGQSELLQALRINKNYIPALTSLAELSLRQQKPNDSLSYVRQILAYDQSNIQATLLGVVSLTALGRYSEARTALVLLEKQYPDNAAIGMHFAFLAIAEKKYNEAEAALRRLGPQFPGDAGPTAAMATIYTSQQQFEKAIHLLQESLRKEPDSIVLRGLLADTATRGRNFDIAVNAYRDLLDKNPKSLELHLRLGALYQTKGDHRSAIEVLHKAQKLAPNDAQLYALLGLSLEATNQSQDARANYQHALQLQPENPTLMNNLAYLLAENGGNLDEALSLVKRALAKVPGQPNYRDTLGWIYVKKKMMDNAVQTFSGLVLQQPTNATFHYHLGYALFEKGDTAKARKALQNALANQPSPEAAMRIKELLAKLG